MDIVNIDTDALYIIIKELFKIDQKKALMFSNRHKKTRDILISMMTDKLEYHQDNSQELKYPINIHGILQILKIYPKLHIKASYN